MIFETHAHYDDPAFDEDRESLLLKLPEEGITRVVNVAASLKGCRDSLDLAKKYDFIYASIGVHPSDTGELTDDDLAFMEKLCREEALQQRGKVVAVGEIGLDYYWDEPDREIQKKWFEAQMEMARRTHLPLIIHSRDAAKNTVDLMQEHHAGEIGGIVHCYSYSVELARTFLDMGFYFGIGGVVTFGNGRKLAEVVKYLPLEKIVLETDSPYLSPVPNRGKRNSSLNLPYVAGKIAELKEITPEQVMQVTFANAEQVYGFQKKKQ